METKNFRSRWVLSQAIKSALRGKFPGVQFSVGTSPATSIERMIAQHDTVFVRWTGAATYGDIKTFLTQELNYTLHGAGIHYAMTKGQQA